MPAEITSIKFEGAELVLGLTVRVPFGGVAQLKEAELVSRATAYVDEQQKAIQASAEELKPKKKRRKARHSGGLTLKQQKVMEKIEKMNAKLKQLQEATALAPSAGP